MQKKFLSEIEIDSKTVIIRADFNIPQVNIINNDHTKILAVVPTIKKLIDSNCKVILLSHLGKPLGEFADEYSLMDIRFLLGKYLEKQIKFVNAKQSLNSIKYLEYKDVLLIENLFFNKEEYSNDLSVQEKFMYNFYTLGDIFVNEAFGVDDNLASIKVLSQKLDSYLGLHYQKELESIKKISKHQDSPFTLIIGGNQIKNKLDLIENILEKVDKIIIGGETGLAFLQAKNVEISEYKYDENILSKIKQIIDKTNSLNKELFLPIDHYAVKDLNVYSNLTEINTQHLPEKYFAVDIGPKTLVMFREIIESSNKILWYGPMGKFENELSNKGTEAIGEYIALSTPKDSYKVAIGDSTSMAIALLKIKQKRFDHISISSTMYSSLIK